MCAVAVSYWSFSLTSALSAIIIVVNNAAAVTDLIIGCQCVRWKLCVPHLIVKCCGPSVQKEGHS